MTELQWQIRVQRPEVCSTARRPPASAGPTAATATSVKDSRRRDFLLCHGVKVRSPHSAGSLLLFVPKRLHLDLPCSKAFQADGGP